MSIVIEKLSFSYGRLNVLQDISAIARPGNITALIGPNASGKSTLLKCIIGVLKPAAGTILLGRQPVHQLRAGQIARCVAYVPQRPTVAAAFSVRQVVELGRYALTPSPAIIEKALQKLDLLDIADRPYPELSVGQQQRVTLARALAQMGNINVSSPPAKYFSDLHSQMLVLDEPTSAMDLNHVAATVALLRELAAAGATVVLALHDLSLASAIADEIWLLDHGSLLASGPPAQTLTIDRLTQVFQTDFEWLTLPDCSRRLLPNIPSHSSPNPDTITAP